MRTLQRSRSVRIQREQEGKVLVAAIRKVFVSFRVYSDVPSTHGELPRAGHLFRSAGTSVHFSEWIFSIFLLTEWI